MVGDIQTNWQEKLEVGDSATQWEYNVRFTWKVN